MKYIKTHIPECISFFLYVVLRIINAFFHEPWYDEAFAWQIARAADWKTILLVEPKFEGHPPLWHMVLALFAKSGAPYEASIALVSLIFTSIAVFLILFKSPLPRFVRLLMPFTYFLFFQYGTVSRPYCMMLLAFILTAMFWKERREKPFRLAVSLIFLCLTSLYGLAFAGGIAMAWAVEYIAESKSLKDFFTGKRCWAMFSLLVAALIIIFDMIPERNATTVDGLTLQSYLKTNPLRFLYLLFVLPADATFTDVFSLGSGIFLRNADFNVPSFVCASVFGALIIIGILIYGYKKKTLLLFIMPYSLFAIIGSFYFSQHHIGIVFLLMLFWLWASMSEPVGRQLKQMKLTDNLRNSIINTLGLNKPQKIFFVKIQAIRPESVSIFNIAACIFAVLTIIVSAGWGMGSFIADVKYNFACGRYLADFIKEHNLTDYKILSQWRISYDENGIITKQNTWEYLYANNLLPYFDRNIFYNYWNGADDHAFEVRYTPTDADNAANLKTWREAGIPDVILNSADTAVIFPDVADFPPYTNVYIEDDYAIWKGKMNGTFAWLAVRDDLLEQLGFDKNAPVSTYVYEYEYGKRKSLPGDKVKRRVIEEQNTKMNGD